ncbi:hypothetical protein AL073_14695 [Loktanella sp. 1ANDIMAR09]|nr:hypothetical protein AL073_14695 [Loktanella sp. 1ANDIMAR09]
MRAISCFLATALTLLAPVIATAQEDTRTVQVRFAAGVSGTTLTDTITGREVVLYTIGAEAGQRMTVTLNPSNLATYFNLYAPGAGPGGEAMAVSQMTPELNAFDGALPLSGDYTVSVYLMRSAARRGEVSDYTLTIGISGDTGAVVQGDFADGLQGGPDFYQVATSGSTLNLRAGPSLGADRLARLSNGQILRNLGCRMAEGRRWCKVATLADPGVEGWTAGDFLIEGSRPITPSVQP